jgi:dihydrofolate synthase/folylpolyglutamate synthase
MPVSRPTITPRYQAALDYLYSFINYENKMPPSPDHARFNLDRMYQLLAALDHPEASYTKVVIAGTKGKGSTATMLEAMLRAAGHRTGLYSSPHLHSWRERVQVNRELIGQEAMATLVERLKSVVEQIEPQWGAPTTFELATALALTHFAESAVDVAVLEIGVGGRYDSVNVIVPTLSVITPISFDHMAMLGSTLAEIAHAKAGIIKPGVPVLVAPQAPEALTVIVQEAGTHAPVWQATADGVKAINQTSSALMYPVAIEAEHIGLGGFHQIENARVAVGAAMLLGAKGVPIDAQAMAEGLAKVRWPARFEVVDEHPRFIIDGAMNGASARRLRESLAAVPHRHLILVLGTSRDKDIGALAAELVPGMHSVILTRSRHPRSTDAETLADAVTPLLEGFLHLTNTVADAIELARSLAEEDDVVCVAGSLFVAAEAREALDLDAVID